MKNVTLSIDERVLSAARRYAAQHGTSLNRLVRGFLEDIAQRQDHAHDVRKRLRALSDESPARIDGEPPARDALHER